MSKIRFSTWFAVDDIAVIRLAEDGYHLPLYIRVMFLALGEANRIGHAPMRAGELRDRLPLLSKDGELTRPKPDSISSAINTAVERGLLGEASRARCLRAPRWHDLRAYKEAFCHTCGADDRTQTQIRRRRRYEISDRPSDKSA